MITCSRNWELRAIDEGRLAPADVAAFERHATACVACREELTKLEGFRALTRQMQVPLPSDLDVRRLRARVLRDAMSGSSSRQPPVVAAIVGVAAIAAAAVTFVHLRGKATKTGDAFAAVVTSSPDAHWTQTRGAGVERIALADGELRLRVRKQAALERFLVALPDGEVEVRGTTFEVSVHDGRTDRVHVEDGVVVVRVHGESVLTAGATWPPPADTASEPAATHARPSPVQTSPSVAPPLAPVAPPPAVRLAPSRREPPAEEHSATEAHADMPTGRAAVTTPSEPSDQEMADYARAIDAYRLGRFVQASLMLATFVDAYPSSPLVDDAIFIEATSLASAGSTVAAARLARQHVARFPNSFHRKDAAILAKGSHDLDGVRPVAPPDAR